MFLYAYEAKETDQVDLSALGLEYAFEGYTVGFNYAFREMEVKVLCQTGGNPRIDEATQTWRKFGDLWIGYETDNPPTAEQLRRKTQLRGREIELNGQMWQVPTAIAWQEVDGKAIPQWYLSRYIDYRDDGTPVYGDVEQQFQPLYDVAMKVLAEDEENGLMVDDLYRYAPIVLGFNYRLSFRECGILKLVTDRAAYEIIDSVVDASSLTKVREYRDQQKKSSTHAASSMSNGGTVEPNTTSQLVPTS